MTALIVTIFAASVLGSLHCAGMCGPFVLFAIGAGDPAVGGSRGFLMAAYHAGRLATYVALGTLAGALGSVMNLAGRLAGVQSVAAVAAGAMMVGFGTVTLLQLAGMRVAAPKLPAGLQKVVIAAHQRSMRRTPVARAVATGLLTTLIPCGWLYAFVITAAGTAHFYTGAAVMAAFWVGTLPALTVLGLGLQKVLGPVARRVPAITASAIVAIGLYTIAARAQVTLQKAATPAANAEQLERDVRAIDREKLPCCATQEGRP